MRPFSLVERFVIIKSIWRYKTNKKAKERKSSNKENPKPKVILCGTALFRAAARKKAEEEAKIPIAERIEKLNQLIDQASSDKVRDYYIRRLEKLEMERLEKEN